MRSVARGWTFRFAKELTFAIRISPCEVPRFQEQFVSKEKVLVTGGAGFIGRHICRALLEHGHDVVILDSIIEQVHGHADGITIPKDIEFIRGDIRNRDVTRRALEAVDSVIHLAAEVGVGQSMYAIEQYVSVNDCGTAVLMEELSRAPVRRIVVASSMSIYGEGLCRARDGSLVEVAERGYGTRQSWNPVDKDGHPLEPIPTPETKRPSLASIYALTKYSQERMTLLLAKAHGMEGCALRLFNVFGPGQALSNPYTGVLAIFASRFLNGKRPLVFEDGMQRRDFVHVEDVADAFLAALQRPNIEGGVFNIGSGNSYTISEVATKLAEAMGRPDITPEILDQARFGDIRHCFADITLAKAALGYRPKRRLEDSLGELVDWVKTQRALDRVAEARAELEARGLVA
jgi:dTDP-L-rhamnose 4-epimerase